MQRLSLLLASIFLLLSTPGCDLSGGAQECNLAASTREAPADMSVEYRATATGDGSFDSVTYRDGNGEQTVNSPGAGWSRTVSVSQGTMVGISARGEVENGSLKVEYSGEYSLGLGSFGSISSSDLCSGSSD